MFPFWIEFSGMSLVEWLPFFGAGLTLWLVSLARGNCRA
jgi:hypothetical protein